jgi:replicative DNA helicase
MPDQEGPPQNIDAEESVLGAMLVSERALKRVRVDSGLTAKHFYLDKHREIFAGICHVAQGNGVADELMVSAKLPAHKATIAELTAKVPAAGNALHYAKIVLVNAQLRAKLEGAQLIQQGVRERHNEERSIDLIREGLQLAASDFTIEAEPTSGEEILDELFEHFDRDEEREVFELPWGELNSAVLGGYRRKQMSVLAGWTNMGKSWGLDQMMACFDAQGKKVAIFATEMSREERAARWLTAQTGVRLEKILRNQLDADDHRRLAEARVAANGRLPFDYFEAFGWSADRICERIIYGGYDVVAIDPVTEIPGFEKPEIASAASRRFAEVAGRANCHVIAVSHLNRARLRDVKGVKPRPVLADLKGSGALETNAHAVLFLHRKQDAETAHILPEGELYFAKVRNGLPAKINIVQSSRTHQFIHLEPGPGHEQTKIEVGSLGHDVESVR